MNPSFSEIGQWIDEATEIYGNTGLESPGNINIKVAKLAYQAGVDSAKVSTMNRVFLLVRKDNWFPLGIFSSMDKLKEALPYMPVRDDEQLMIQEFFIDPKPRHPEHAETTFHDIKSEVVKGPG